MAVLDSCNSSSPTPNRHGGPGVMLELDVTVTQQIETLFPFTAHAGLRKVIKNGCVKTFGLTTQKKEEITAIGIEPQSEKDNRRSLGPEEERPHFPPRRR